MTPKYAELLSTTSLADLAYEGSQDSHTYQCVCLDTVMSLLVCG